VKDEAVHVVREVGQRRLSFSPLDPDRADEQVHFVLLMCEDVLDASAHAGSRRIGLRDTLRYELASPTKIGCVGASKLSALCTERITRIASRRRDFAGDQIEHLTSVSKLP
jgi:hypothetical protein